MRIDVENVEHAGICDGVNVPQYCSYAICHAMFYMYLTLLALVESLVLGNPWYTRSFALILISKTYIIFIQYVMSPIRCHISVQIQTTNMLHTLAYQVIPTSLNQNIHNLEDLPPDYQVSHCDLYVEDILFNYYTPAIGPPNVVENEVLYALPPYRHQPLRDAVWCVEDAHAHLPRGVVPNIKVCPFGLPTGIWREPKNPQGAIQDPLVDCAPACTTQI